MQGQFFLEFEGQTPLPYLKDKKFNQFYSSNDPRDFPNPHKTQGTGYIGIEQQTQPAHTPLLKLRNRD
jgi:hypothetical protein